MFSYITDSTQTVSVDETLCSNCKERPATETWVGEGGVLGFVHGAYAKWCKLCCLKAQLKYAQDAAAQIPEIVKAILECSGVAI